MRRQPALERQPENEDTPTLGERAGNPRLHHVPERLVDVRAAFWNEIAEILDSLPPTAEQRRNARIG